MNPDLTNAPRTIDFGRMPACMDLTAEHVQQLAMKGRELGYDLVKVTMGGRTLFVTTALPHEPRKETLAFIRRHGIVNDPAMPPRPALVGVCTKS